MAFLFNVSSKERERGGCILGFQLLEMIYFEIFESMRDFIIYASGSLERNEFYFLK